MSLLLENVIFKGTVLGETFKWRDSVRVATTTTGNINTSFQNGAVIDGITLITGDRILIKDQADATQNGIYVVQTTGVPIRSVDSQLADNISGIVVVVVEGTQNKAGIFICVSPFTAATVGTHNIIFNRSDVPIGTLEAARGGTGVSNLTNGRVLVGAGTNPVNLTKVSPSGDFVGTSDVQTMTNKTLSQATLQTNSLTFRDVVENQSMILNLGLLTGTRTLYTPDSDGILATRDYVDENAQGLSIKAAVRVTTLVNGNFATAFQNGATVDGVVLQTGNRILIKNQADATQNGIYVVQASGAPVRATDADNMPLGEVQTGMYTYVEEGTLAFTGWVLTTPNPITLDITPLTFTQFSAAGQTIAGTGLSKAGSTFNVNLTANGGIITDSNFLRLNLSASALQGTLPVAHGGTGLSSYTLNRFITSDSVSNTLLTTSKVVPAGDVVGTTDVQTMTNKTLTNPQISQISNGSLVLTLSGTGSANNFQFTSSNPTVAPVLSVLGSDTNIAMRMQAKGTGVYEFLSSSTAASTLRLYEQTTNGGDHVSIRIGNLLTSWNLTLPTSAGSVGQVLQTDGAGTTSWVNFPGVFANGGIIIDSGSYRLDLSASNIQGVLGLTNGGTGRSSYTANTFLTVDTVNNQIINSSKVIPTGVVVGTTDSQTMTNKTLTSPSINHIRNGGTVLVFTGSGTSNHFNMLSTNTGHSPMFSVIGTDTNIAMRMQAKGTGVYEFLSTDTTPSTLRLYEQTTNGTEHVNLRVPALGSSWTLTLPNSAGSNGQLLQTNGSGVTNWVNLTTGDVVGTTDVQTLSNKTLESPQIDQIYSDGLIINLSGGGTRYLTVSNNAFYSGMVLLADGPDQDVSMQFLAKGNGNFMFENINNSATVLRLKAPNSGNYLNLTTPSLLAGYSLTLPNSAGTNGQLLQTNGSGVTSWVTPTEGYVYNFLHGAVLLTGVATVVSGSGFAWRHADYSNRFVGQGICFFHYTSTSADRSLTVQVWNETTNTQLGTSGLINPGAGNTSSSVSFAFNQPSANAHLVLRVQKSADGGSQIIIRSAQIEFNV